MKRSVNLHFFPFSLFPKIQSTPFHFYFGGTSLQVTLWGATPGVAAQLLPSFELLQVPGWWLGGEQRLMQPSFRGAAQIMCISERFAGQIPCDLHHEICLWSADLCQSREMQRPAWSGLTPCDLSLALPVPMLGKEHPSRVFLVGSLPSFPLLSLQPPAFLAHVFLEWPLPTEQHVVVQ